MASSSPGMEPQGEVEDRRARPKRQRRRIGVLLVGGVMCIMTAVAIRQYLYRSPSVDGQTLTRKKRNAPYH